MQLSNTIQSFAQLIPLNLENMDSLLVLHPMLQLMQLDSSLQEDFLNKSVLIQFMLVKLKLMDLTSMLKMVILLKRNPSRQFLTLVLFQLLLVTEFSVSSRVLVMVESMSPTLKLDSLVMLKEQKVKLLNTTQKSTEIEFSENILMST